MVNLQKALNFTIDIPNYRGGQQDRQHNSGQDRSSQMAGSALTDAERKSMRRPRVAKPQTDLTGQDKLMRRKKHRTAGFIKVIEFRSFGKIRRIVRTIADLDGEDAVGDKSTA